MEMMEKRGACNGDEVVRFVRGLTCRRCDVRYAHSLLPRAFGDLPKTTHFLPQQLPIVNGFLLTI